MRWILLLSIFLPPTAFPLGEHDKKYDFLVQKVTIFLDVICSPTAPNGEWLKLVRLSRSKGSGAVLKV